MPGTLLIDIRFQGMRREAVQEERHRANSNGSGRESRDGRGGDLDGMGDLGSVGGADAIGGADMPLDRIIEAESRYKTVRLSR